MKLQDEFTKTNQKKRKKKKDSCNLPVIQRRTPPSDPAILSRHLQIVVHVVRRHSSQDFEVMVEQVVQPDGVVAKEPCHNDRCKEK